MKFRRQLVLSASALAPLAMASYAMAQTTPAASEGSELEEVVVSGSRLTSRNFVQPTPTSVVSAQDIENLAHYLVGL